MLDNKENLFQPPTEVIALPPLKMVLVHAHDERDQALSAAIKSAQPQEHIKPVDLKKLIEHLEQQS